MEKRGYGQKILNTTIDNNSESSSHAHLFWQPNIISLTVTRKVPLTV